MDAFEARFQCLRMAQELIDPNDRHYHKKLFNLATRFYGFLETKTSEEMIQKKIWYIDVGNMEPEVEAAHVEKIKNEIHQRKILNESEPQLSQKIEFDIKSTCYSFEILKWSEYDKFLISTKVDILYDYLEKHTVTMDEITHISLSDDDRLIVYYNKPLPSRELAREIIKYLDKNK
jgi:predicted RNA-binding protein Jag